MLAIVSTNLNKYSETFIASHREYLDVDVLNLFDGYLPMKYFFGSKTETQFQILSKDRETQKHEIKKLFIQYHVHTVLAEYGPSGAEMFEICFELEIPLIVHFHGYDAYRSDILQSYGKGYPEMFSKMSAAVVVSNDMKNQLVKLGCDPEKIFLIPYGIELKYFYQPSKTTMGLRLVSCGRFVEKKSPERILMAFAGAKDVYPDLSITMIGDGELLYSCQELAKKLNIEKDVDFTGVLPPQRIAEIFKESSIFLQHSIVTDMGDSEGTPLAILEAGASGLAVIATRHAGIPDVVEDEINGYLVEEKDVQTMTDRIVYLVKNPNKAIVFGRKLQEKVVQSYSMERYISDLKNLIQNFRS